MMKKFISLIFSVLFLFVITGCDKNTEWTSPNNDYTNVYNYGDDYFKSIGNRVTLDYDSSNYIYNDFSNGIDEKVFSIATGVWNNEGILKHNGVRQDNIFLTDEGYLAFRINGDYYRGDDVDKTNGIRSGAALVTDEDIGPGRFEIRMKAAPRSGSVSAFWTYQYNTSNSLENGWNEIDIEIVGGGNGGSFDSIWYTTWQKALSQNNKVYKFEDILLNDNTWHTHTFDWYTDYMGTGKARIDWFIDGNLMYYTEKEVATKSGNLWLGVWRPSEFAGLSQFETAYMLVDFVRYTPFMNMDNWEETGYSSNYNNSNKNFPTEKIQLTDEMLNQRLANTGFENVDTPSSAPTIPYVVDYENYAAVGWIKKDIFDELCNATITTDSNSGTNAILINSGAVEQNIESVYENYKYSLSFFAKKNITDGSLLIRYYDLNGGFLKDEEIIITSDNYIEYTKLLSAPKNCGSIRISLRSGCFDDIKCTFTGKKI
jgi:hypothetical protein